MKSEVKSKENLMFDCFDTFTALMLKNNWGNHVQLQLTDLKLHIFAQKKVNL